MQLKTILNRVQRHPSFVYEAVRLVEGDPPALEVKVRARANSRPCCSGCGRPGPGYDTLGMRRFEFVPLWGMAVCLVYAMRRVDCPSCGVRVERVPWATGKRTLTDTYLWFLC
jgi:transposase